MCYGSCVMDVLLYEDSDHLSWKQQLLCAYSRSKMAFHVANLRGFSGLQQMTRFQKVN